MIPENTLVCLTERAGETGLPCGQIFRGRLVYWSCTNTFMRKYKSPRGFLTTLVALLAREGVKEVDLLMPSVALRCTVKQLQNAPVHEVYGAAQHFLHRDAWDQIVHYDKPHYETLTRRVYPQHP